MGTHGPRFVPRQPLASAGLAPQINWQEEFYDDSIRDWGLDVKSIIESIQSTHFNRNTYIFTTSPPLAGKMSYRRHQFGG